MLSDDEIKEIQDLYALLEALPNDFLFGVVELNKKYCILRLEEETFLISPVQTENVGELYRKLLGAFKNE
jgi:hypothetical protein